MNARIAGIRYALPEEALTNEHLSAQIPGTEPAKLAQKLGIRERRIAGPDECASDLAVRAAEALFEAGVAKRSDADAVVMCTQSPDYFLPTTACLIQARLGLPEQALALDINLGCSGYVVGLALAKGLIESGQVRHVLLLTGDTYSKYLAPDDRSCRAVFGDGAAATWLAGDSGGDGGGIGPFVFGVDGRGGEHLIVPAGGCRRREPPTESDRYLRMNGAEIFAFTLRRVPDLVRRLLATAQIAAEDVDLFVFHQANRYMLEHLCRQMGLPSEKCPVHMEMCGNTVSTSIPIVLAELERAGRLQRGQRIMLVGFGVGLSWAAGLVRW